MNRKELKTRARATIKGKIWMVLAITLIVGIGVSLIGQFTYGLGTLLVTGSIMISLAVIFLKMVQEDRKPELGDILIGFKGDNFKRGLVAYLLMTVYVMLWSLLLIVPGIIKALAYSQVFYILADDDKIDPKEALKKSNKMMEGHKGEFFMLGLSFLGWGLLTAITFGIAAIWVAPYMQATYANYYLYLKGESGEGKKKDE
ncbi:DUF975 family protein [Microgenomates group bacterium]|nr:DUF975 family protein [Microgenomates group bacterium]